MLKMAKYRPIYMKIWKDPDFEDYELPQKIIFLYLLTNESTTESGIYPITLKTISNETSVPIETVKQIFENGLIKNVCYDHDNKIVFVKNFRKYGAGGGKPELIVKSIQKDCQLTKYSGLWKEYIREYPEQEANINSVLNGYETVRKRFNK
jgi:hypothetical protein